MTFNIDSYIYRSESDIPERIKDFDYEVDYKDGVILLNKIRWVPYDDKVRKAYEVWIKDRITGERRLVAQYICLNKDKADDPNFIIASNRGILQCDRYTFRNSLGDYYEDDFYYDVILAYKEEDNDAPWDSTIKDWAWGVWEVWDEFLDEPYERILALDRSGDEFITVRYKKLKERGVVYNSKYVFSYIENLEKTGYEIKEIVALPKPRLTGVDPMWVIHGMNVNRREMEARARMQDPWSLIVEE
jgi:hypothetical protein